MNIYLAVILATLVAAYALDSAARLLNLRALTPVLPDEFRGLSDPETYRKSQEYTKAAETLSQVSATWELALLAGFMLLGGFAALDARVRCLGLPEVPTGLAYLAAVGLLHDLVSTPLDLYRTFVLEERFGFNKTTPGLYLKDKLKGYALTALIGGPLLAAILLFFSRLGSGAWLWAWGLTVLATLGLQYVAPAWILPLFNKFTPLPGGPLRSRIEALAAAQGFTLSGVFVMDGSKRSTRSNAFLTGFGAKKRIALYDTLLAQLSDDQLVAVLAHELGHYRLGHIPRMLAASSLHSGLLYLLMGFFIHNPALAAAFGLDAPSTHTGLVFFLLLYTPASLALSIATGALSRRHEYQADRFAAQATGAPEDLVAALSTLSVRNLSNLTPHPLNVLLHYSHPPVLARIRALREPRD